SSPEGAEPIHNATSAGVMPSRMRLYCSRVNRPRGPDNCHQPIAAIATARHAMSHQRRRGNLIHMAVILPQAIGPLRTWSQPRPSKYTRLDGGEACTERTCKAELPGCKS